MIFDELKPLAEQGIAEAQYNLGLMYSNGRVFPAMMRKQSSGIGWRPNRGSQNPKPTSG